MLSGENLWLQYKQSVVSRGRGSSGRAMYGILGVGGREREREEGEEGRGRRETDLTSLARQMSVISFKSAKIENTSSSAVKIFSSRHNLYACACAGDVKHPGDVGGVGGGDVVEPPGGVWGGRLATVTDQAWTNESDQPGQTFCQSSRNRYNL